MKLSLQIWRFHVFFSCKHLICVAADGVDLTVVYHKTVRMCPLPAWICVGTETGMYHGDCRFIIRVLKVFEESTKLSNQEHTFVNDSTAAHGNYVSVIITLLKLTSCNVEHTVKWKTFFHIFRLFDKCLHNAWHTFSCLVSKHFRKYRNLTPSKELQTFFFKDDLKHLLCLCTFDLVLWEEKLCDTVFSLIANFKSLFLTGFFEKFMRNLKKNTYTITGFAFCIFTCTVLQMFYDF